MTLRLRLWAGLALALLLSSCGKGGSADTGAQFVGVWTADMAATEAAATRSPATDRSAAFVSQLAVVAGALADGDGVKIHLLADGRVEISGPAGELPPGAWRGYGDTLTLDPDGTGKITETYRLVGGKLVGPGGVTLSRR